jgi:hypothetical protein
MQMKKILMITLGVLFVAAVQCVISPVRVAPVDQDVGLVYVMPADLSLMAVTPVAEATMSYDQWQMNPLLSSTAAPYESYPAEASQLKGVVKPVEGTMLSSLKNDKQTFTSKTANTDYSRGYRLDIGDNCWGLKAPDILI